MDSVRRLFFQFIAQYFLSQSICRTTSYAIFFSHGRICRLIHLIPSKQSLGHRQHQYVALHYWRRTWFPFAKRALPVFLIKFPARYVSCACGPLHTTPIPHSFPSPYPPLPSLRRCLGRRRNPHPRTQSGESPPGVCVSSPLFHQSAQDSADRGLALIDSVVFRVFLVGVDSRARSSFAATNRFRRLPTKSDPTRKTSLDWLLV